MLGKRWILGTAVTQFATASIAISGAPPASAVTAQQGTVTVTPSQHLADPELVHVSWTGVPSSGGFYIIECARSVPANEFDVPQQCAFLDSATSSPRDVTVHKGYLGQGGYQCPQSGSDSCVLAVLAFGQVNGAYHYAQTPITFSNMSLTPSSGPKGTSVKVHGLYVSPGDTVTVKYKTGLSSPRSAPLCSAVAIGYTTFDCTGTIPAGSQAGTLGVHPIVAKANSGKFKINYTLTT